MDSRLVTNPQAFVQRQSKYPGIRTQSAFVLLAGIAFALQHFGNVFLLEEGYEHVNSVVWSISLATLVVPFVVWGTVTVVVYFVARLFQGYFPPGLLFRLTGWGMAPLIGAGLVRSAGTLYALRGAEPPEEPAFSAFQYSYESYQSYTSAATSDPAFVAGIVLAVPFVLYSGYIWATVVEGISDVTRRESICVAAVPTLLCLLWIASPILF